MSLFSPLVAYRDQHRLSYRLLFYVVLCSSFFTLLATAFQLYLDYRRDLNFIETNLKFIEDSYIPAVTASLFNMDEKQLAILLKGALKLPDIEYLTVHENIGEAEYRSSQGNPDAQKDIVKVYPLEYRMLSGDKITGGTLTVTASLKGVYQRLWSRILVVMVTNAIKTFVAASFIFFIIQFLITRHLTTMAKFTQRLDLDSLNTRMTLNRKTSESSAPDELDQVVTALNDMQERMRLDIAKRKEAEESLRKSEEKYRFVTEKAIDVLWQCDLAGNLIFVSPSFEILTGYSVEEGLSLNMWDLLTPNSAKHAINLLDQRRRADSRSGTVYEPVMLELDYIHKQDTIRYCEVTAGFVKDENNTPTGITGITRDVTDKKRLEKQLLQAQKIESIGTLAGGIAHDFNNILGGIIGYTELAQFDLPEGSSARTRLDRVLKSADRAKNLVQQILAFSRQGEQEEKPIQLVPIIKEVLTMLRASIPATIEIRQNIQRESGTVVVDSTQVHQVLMNLCTNAAHAMSEKGGILEVSLEDVDLDEEAVTKYPDLEPGSYVKFTVSDTGHGMSEAIKEKIFDPYFTTKDKGVGTGLGLAVVHGIVKSHGGEVSVESKPGRGTTFEVLLPMINITPAEVTETLEILPTGNEYVLFVDDEHALVEIGRQMLEHLGYRSVSKTSPIEALEAFQAEPDKFDLVITDQTMPIMTGEMLAKKLLSIRPDIPIVLCTGFSDLIAEGKARALGIREFVMKPILMSDFAKTVKKALGKD